MELARKLDMAGFSKELRLLLDIMKMQNHETPHPVVSNWTPDVNWDRFIQLVIHHRVFPVVYLSCKKMRECPVPTNILQTLQQLYQKNTLHMLWFSGEMERLSRLLAEQEIQVLFLKGPTLALDLYGDLSKRTASDLDILISLNDLSRAEDLLYQMGYRKDEYIQSILNDWKWRHHHFSYFHPQKRLKVELHWRLNPGPSMEPAFQEFWKRRRQSPLSGSTVFQLGLEDLFLFLVSHGARHGWSRLRWLQDIDRMACKGLDWDRARALLASNGLLHVGGQALVMASQLLDTPLHGNVRRMIHGKTPFKLAQAALFYVKRIVNLHSLPLPDEVATYHKRHLFALMSFKQKILFVLSFLYPYPDDAKVMPLPKPMHFLYFPLRPILWLYRKSRKQAAL